MGLSRNGRLSNQIGASRLGCLLRIALLAAVIWIGFKVADPYVKYWQLKDEMKQSARFATTMTDEEIRRRIVAEARRLNLPEQAEHVGIHRQPGRNVVIWLEYTVTVDFPRFDQHLTFRPVVEAPL